MANTPRTDRDARHPLLRAESMENQMIRIPSSLKRNLEAVAEKYQATIGTVTRVAIEQGFPVLLAQLEGPAEENRIED